MCGQRAIFLSLSFDISSFFYHHTGHVIFRCQQIVTNSHYTKKHQRKEYEIITVFLQGNDEAIDKFRSYNNS